MATTTTTKKVKKSGSYIYTIGRRKSSVARIRLHKKGNGTIEINDKPLTEYFGSSALQTIVKKPLEKIGGLEKYDVTVRVEGGGGRGQADSISLGITRALVQLDENLRKVVKPLGLLTRDPRVKERKKYGLKKARRAPQWAKR